MTLELQDVPLEMLFDGDDADFEGVDSRSSHTSTNNKPKPDVMQTNFLHCDDDDDLLASLELGISQQQPHREVGNGSSVSSSNAANNQVFNDSLTELYRTADNDPDDYAWGSAARNKPNTRNPNIRPGPFERTGQSPLLKRGRIDTCPNVALNEGIYINRTPHLAENKMYRSI